MTIDPTEDATVTQLAESRETWMEEAEKWKRRAEAFEDRCDNFESQIAAINKAQYEVLAATEHYHESWMGYWSQQVEEVARERDKYRAALKKIADEHPDHPGNTMSIVREALS